MDWTFWAGLVGIAALWALGQWAFSPRRHSEKTRGHDDEAADAIVDIDRQKSQADAWRQL